MISLSIINKPPHICLEITAGDHLEIKWSSNKFRSCLRLTNLLKFHQTENNPMIVVCNIVQERKHLFSAPWHPACHSFFLTHHLDTTFFLVICLTTIVWLVRHLKFCTSVSCEVWNVLVRTSLVLATSREQSKQFLKGLKSMSTSQTGTANC